MYKIIGVDGREYGPVSFEQLKQWVTEGRVNAQTRVQPAGVTEWKSALEIAELNALFPPPSTPAGTQAPPPPSTMAPVPAAPPQQKGLAITSFVLGLVSFVLCLGFLTGIPAIICGHIAHGRARRLPAQHGGSGLAVAGLILGYVSLVYTLLIVALLLPAFSQARRHAQSTMCGSQMRQIGLAFRLWGVDHQDQFPFNVSTNSGGTKEFCATGKGGFDKNAPLHFAVLSRELGTTKVLVCPQDTSKKPASDFEHLTSENISYRMRTGPELADNNASEVLAECPIHGTVLHCDGSIEEKPHHRRLGDR